jgi:hypothetical protein
MADDLKMNHPLNEAIKDVVPPSFKHCHTLTKFRTISSMFSALCECVKDENGTISSMKRVPDEEYKVDVAGVDTAFDLHM